MGLEFYRKPIIMFCFGDVDGSDPGYGGADPGGGLGADPSGQFGGGSGGVGLGADLGIASEVGDILNGVDLGRYSGANYTGEALGIMRARTEAFSGMNPNSFSAAELDSRYTGMHNALMGMSLPATPGSIAAGLTAGLMSAITSPSKLGMAIGNTAIGLPTTQSLAKTADQGMRAHAAISKGWTGSPQSLNQAQRDFGFDPNTKSLPGERPNIPTPRQGITPQAKASIMANRGFQMGRIGNGGRMQSPYSSDISSMYTRSPLSSGVNAFPGSGMLPSNYYM
jgi:hypothetical protein